MLCITMRGGDYFTVGDKIVVQLERLSGDRAHLIINAPKKERILRGDVLERDGGERPGCVLEISPRPVRQLTWNHAKKEAMAELRRELKQMGESPQTELIREKLAIIFPVRRENEDSAEAGR